MLAWARALNRPFTVAELRAALPFKDPQSGPGGRLYHLCFRGDMVRLRRGVYEAVRP